MAFGISAYEQNIKNVDATDSTTSGKSVAAVRAANAAALGSAKEGQVVTGEVASVNGRTVQLKLPDSQVVTARLEADVKIGVGESLAFAVKSNTGSQIALTPLFNSSAVNATAIKALQMASIMVNDDTLSMASAMMDEGMPVDKNSLQAMYRLMGKYMGADPADIVAMLKQGIDINEDSLAQFSAYRNNTHQIINAASELSDSLMELADEATIGQRLELAEIFNGPVTSETEENMLKGLDKMVQEYEQHLQEELDKAMQKPSGILDVAKSIHDMKPEIPSELFVDENEMEVVVTEEKETELNSILNGQERDEIAKTLSKLGVDAENLETIKNGEMEPKQLLSYIQNAGKLLEKGEVDKLNLPEESKEEMKTGIKALMDGNAYKALLKSTVMKNFTIKPDGTTDNDTVRELYQKILEDTQKVSQLLESMGKGDSTLAKGLDNLKQNVNFMNQLNEAFTYVQLPIKLSGGEAHGDLYVYTNKKKLMEHDGEISALLHLEMESLGTMDVMVVLKDSNKVNTDFTLQDEDTLDFVEQNIHILDERLTKRGYNMSITTKVKTDKDKENVTNPAIAPMLGSVNTQEKKLISRFSFDMKA